MNPVETLKAILKEMENHKEQYVAKPQKDFTRNRKVTFYGMMWFLLFIGTNSMSEETAILLQVINKLCEWRYDRLRKCDLIASFKNSAKKISTKCRTHFIN